MILSTSDELELNAGRQRRVKEELDELRQARNAVLKPIERDIMRGLFAASGKIFTLDGKGDFTYISDENPIHGRMDKRAIERLESVNIRATVKEQNGLKIIVIDTTQPGFLTKVNGLKQASEEITR